MRPARDLRCVAQVTPSRQSWWNRHAAIDLASLERNVPCRDACPVHTNAGGYVSLVAQGRFREAYELARRPNPFASVCGRICAHPCEAACRRGSIDAPIQIHYGTRDGLVYSGTPPEWSLALTQALREANNEVELYQYENEGHSFIGQPWYDFMGRVLRFFDQSLK